MPLKETLENLKVDPHRILTHLSQQGFSKCRDWGEGVFQCFLESCLLSPPPEIQSEAD